MVDFQDNPCGEVSRKECHLLPGKLHRAVMVVLKNKDDQILLAQRAKGKLWEGVWDGTCATHVYPQETNEHAVARALKNELGLNDLTLKYKGKFLYQARWGKVEVEYEVCHLFLGTIDSQPTPNAKEIISLKWMSQKKRLGEVGKNQNLFTPWFLISLKELFPK